MDDRDRNQNRVKIIKDYSFSPTKTPSKDAKDYLMMTKQKYQDVSPFREDFDNSQYEYAKSSNFKYLKKRHAESNVRHDLDNFSFKMIDQDHLSSIDKYITQW